MDQSRAHYLRQTARSDRSGAKRPCATSTLLARLFPIVGALQRCGIPSGSEAAPAPDSNEMRCRALNSDETTRRILLASFSEARATRQAPFLRFELKYAK